MRFPIVSLLMIAALLLPGCGKKSELPVKDQVLVDPPQAVMPATQVALIAWKQGDKSAAVSSFIDADWTSRKLFASDSVLSLSEDQFKSLTDEDRATKSKEMLAQIDTFKQLMAAVIQSGQDAAAKGDAAQARKCFASLKQCGTALDSPNCLSLVRMVGQAATRRADAELAKLGK
jgi:hypothetical protein